MKTDLSMTDHGNLHSEYLKEIERLKAQSESLLRANEALVNTLRLNCEEVDRLNALLEEGREVYKKLLPDANENGIYASWGNCRDMWKFIKKIGESNGKKEN